MTSPQPFARRFAALSPFVGFLSHLLMSGPGLLQIGNPKSRCYAFRMDGKDIKFFW